MRGIALFVPLLRKKSLYHCYERHKQVLDCAGGGGGELALGGGDCHRIAQHLNCMSAGDRRSLGTDTGSVGGTQDVSWLPLILCLNCVSLTVPQVSEFN
jgi:hypothetical protein